MASHADEDLVATKTEGYKAGEKKTIDEYQKLGEFWGFPRRSPRETIAVDPTRIINLFLLHKAPHANPTPHEFTSQVKLLPYHSLLPTPSLAFHLLPC